MGDYSFIKSRGLENLENWVLVFEIWKLYNQDMDNKILQMASKLSKRFYLQILIFFIVVVLHFLITPMLEVEDLSDFSADPGVAFIWITLLQPMMSLFLLLEPILIKVYITFGIPPMSIVYLSSSLMYGFMSALLFSEKKYLRVISIIFIVISIFLSISYWFFLAMIN